MRIIPRVYLAGPIKGLSESEASSWREKFREDFHGIVEAKSPLDNEYKYRDLQGRDLYKAIAFDERLDILNCHAVIAYVPYDSMGTAMGMMYGFLSGRTVVLVKGKREQQLSKMVLYHSHRQVTSFEEAVKFVIERHNRQLVERIINRQGEYLPWDSNRIQRSIQNAIRDVYTRANRPLSEAPRSDILANIVVMRVFDKVEEGELQPDNIDVEIIQDIIEKTLMDNSQREEVHTLAKGYIIYRHKRQEMRVRRFEEQETQDFLLNSILHDIKGKVGNIDRYTRDFIQPEDIREELRNDYLDLRRNIEALFLAIEQAKIKLDRRFISQSINLKDAFDKVVAEQPLNPNISVVNDIPTDFYIQAPPERIHSVFSNLLENSLKYGCLDGRGKFSIKGEYLNDGNLLLLYWNEGPRLTREEAEQIFSGIRRPNSSPRSFQHGMLQVKRYVESVGGSIECRPMELYMGQPAEMVERGYPVFRITFPVSKKNTLAVKKILVADDDTMDRKMVCRNLRDCNVTFLEAATVDEAIALLSDSEIVAAIIDKDFKDPLQDGIKLAEQIYRKRPDIHTIMITGSNSLDDSVWRNKLIEEYRVLKILDKQTYRKEDLLNALSGVLR